MLGRDRDDALGYKKQELLEDTGRDDILHIRKLLCGEAITNLALLGRLVMHGVGERVHSGYLGVLDIFSISFLFLECSVLRVSLLIIF